MEFGSLVDKQGVIAELANWIEQSGDADYITFSGSGEPTLNIDLGEIINAIKEMSDIPVAVLTNGSTLWLAEVRQRLMLADLVIPNLDAGEEETFLRINRPAAEVNFDKMVQGLIDFSSEFSNQVWLEIFIIKGINDSLESIKSISSIVDRIKPYKVQLNSIHRPPAVREIKGLTRDELCSLCSQFNVLCQVIAYNSQSKPKIEQQAMPDRERIISMLKRRPGSLQDLVHGLELGKEHAEAIIDDLVEQGIIETELVEGRLHIKLKIES